MLRQLQVRSAVWCDGRSTTLAGGRVRKATSLAPARLEVAEFMMSGRCDQELEQARLEELEKRLACAAIVYLKALVMLTKTRLFPVDTQKSASFLV